MIALAIAAALALPAKLVPVDHCSSDDSFALFHETLVSAAAREDAAALNALIVPELRAKGTVDDWPRLRMLLRMGCVGSGESRVLPSAMHQLRDVPPESLSGRYIVLPGADLLASTDDPNSVVDGAVMKWDIVTATNLAGHVWTGVSLPDGRSGWIRDADLYSLEFPARILIGRRDGQWMITGLE